MGKSSQGLRDCKIPRSTEILSLVGLHGEGARAGPVSGLPPFEEEAAATYEG